METKNRLYLALALITLMVLVIIIMWVTDNAEEVPNEITNTTPGVSTPEDTAEKFTEKGDVSQNAEEIKQELIAPLGGGAGTLFENEEIRIDYIPPINPFPDRFSIEIFIENSVKAKQTTVEWFGEQGFSSDDVCELPILFFLSTDVAEIYTQQERTFNPLLENC